MIRVACPHCQRTFRTMTEGMGKTAVCSGCQQTFKIGSARPPFTWKPSTLAEDSWVGVEAPAEKKERKHCIICDAPLEDDAFRCLACGANQVTGLVHKARPKVKDDVKVSPLAMLPWRMIAILAIVVAAGAGIFFGVQHVFFSVAESGVEMARHRMIMEAARHLAEGRGEESFREKYAGKVDDANLSRYLQMLEAGDGSIRSATPALIGCGKVTQVGPIVSAVKSSDPNVAQGAVKVLQAIGPRRLVELSNSPEEPVRPSAARALCVLFNLPASDQNLADLSERVETPVKLDRLNSLCRDWPRAVGEFAVKINGQVCPAPAIVEQYGRIFYLRVGNAMFMSLYDTDRTFAIPAESWCAATGVAVDIKEIRTWVSGTITLTSPFGVGWQGEARVKALQKLGENPPGCLPVAPLDRDKAAPVPIEFTQD